MTTVTTSLVGEDVSYLPARSSVQETNTLGVRTESPAQFKFASESTGGAPITVLQDDLFRGYNDRERLLGKIEGIQIANRQKGTELSQSDCYRLCGVPDPGGCGTDSVSLKQNNTPPSVPGAVEISGSPLSDCPSDLSDWEDDKKVGLGRQKIYGPQCADSRSRLKVLQRQQKANHTTSLGMSLHRNVRLVGLPKRCAKRRRDLGQGRPSCLGHRQQTDHGGNLLVRQGHVSPSRGSYLLVGLRWGLLDLLQRYPSILA
jgi:hypothetical protein